MRTKITRDMWEALNSTWLAYEAIKPAEITAARLPELLDWIRERASLFRGALLGTILRDDGYYFSQLGAFVERADNTARILDVKYFILLPTNQMIGGDDRHLPMGDDPALGLGAPLLPARLPRELPALERRRLPDPAWPRCRARCASATTG